MPLIDKPFKRVAIDLVGPIGPPNEDGYRYMYGLLTKCEVKMAGYWPSSFFACLWTETKSRSINSQKKNEANVQPS